MKTGEKLELKILKGKRKALLDELSIVDFSINNILEKFTKERLNELGWEYWGYYTPIGDKIYKKGSVKLRASGDGIIYRDSKEEPYKRIENISELEKYEKTKLK